MSRPPILSGAVWHAADLRESSTWTDVLDREDADALVSAVAHARHSGRTIETLTRGDFPLGRLAGRVREWERALHDGRGFVLVRGFPVGRLVSGDVELAYLGLGLQLGTPVSQDALGTILGHVRDRRQPRTGPEVRLYATNQRQDFHTDGADLIGLLCLHRAKAGGESRIVSAAAVYNELLRRDPDLVDVLYQPMYWDRNNEQSAGEDPFYALPVLHDVNGRPRFFYIGWYIRDAQRHARVPRLTSVQLAAMDAVESIANDPAFHVEMDFQPGDVQLLNNSVILHSREAYEDFDDLDARRHLLRLWLRAHAFTAVDDVLRGGIPTRVDAP